MDPAISVNAAVRVATNQLTDEELNALTMVLLLDADPRPVSGYSKVQSLFTQENGAKMHELTRDAFMAIARERLGV